jgi:16S rRNA (cytosine967-C5)-methyltransferase
MSSTLAPTSLAFSLLHAARVMTAVLQGQSLAEGMLSRIDVQARPAVQDLVYCTLRSYGRGDFLLSRLLSKPLAVLEIHTLLLAALYRLETRPDAVHTVVDQAVVAAGEIEGGRLKALVNGVLRNFLRQQESLLQSIAGVDVAQYQHPDWWLDQLQRAWPKNWRQIAEAGNLPPPMALRVNRRKSTPAEYLLSLENLGIKARIEGESAILLESPQAIERLPGFADGLVSVQDPGAQRAASLLDLPAGSRVLDACAAPGGKTAHLLERADLNLLALDLKPARCRRIEDNLQRLGLHAEIKVADCIKRDTWWDELPFDAILADVPCTASGVVRRNPDAKWLRREADIASFAATQARILDSLWIVLRPGGKFLYATCSVFPAENSRQIARFLKRQPTASLVHKEQILPDADHDGFFYALLEKRV